MMKHDQRMVDTDDWYLAMRAPRKAKSHWLDRHWLAIDAGLFLGNKLSHKYLAIRLKTPGPN